MGSNTTAQAIINESDGQRGGHVLRHETDTTGGRQEDGRRTEHSHQSQNINAWPYDE